MKEDVLEQVVEDYLQLNGYFTTHNVSFKPDKAHAEYVSREDSVPSDIDVVGYRPRGTGVEKVMAVSCKAWQDGFDPRAKLRGLREGLPKNNRRKTWHQFRELWKPKWSAAFHDAVVKLTGEREFTYCIAVTRLTGKLTAEDAAAEWSNDPTIRENLNGCMFRFLTLEEMWGKVVAEATTRPAPSEIGRLAQLLKAARLPGVS
jgi:hypothetical protein